MAVETRKITEDEDGMRLDRWFKAHYPALPFGHLQKLLRTGQVRVDGGRVKAETRLAAGQTVRVPPLKLDEMAERPRAKSTVREGDARLLKDMTLFEDRDVLVLNKPAGLAVQGGSGTHRHIDGMLEALATPDGDRPRLVHRLDRDTAGVLLVAKTRKAAADLAKTFRSRSARKIYWALVQGVPRPAQGRISTYLAKTAREEGETMRIAAHGEEGAQHAVSYYALIERAGGRLSWLSLKPVTGRTHQLRAHMSHIGHPIVGDPKYGHRARMQDGWDLPEDMPAGLHLLARRLVIPHPRGGTIDVTAPLPEHMRRSFDLLGFDASSYDPIVDSPDE